MQVIFDRLIGKINREIGWLLGVFRCGWSDRYIQHLLKKQGIAVDHLSSSQNATNAEIKQRKMNNNKR